METIFPALLKKRETDSFNPEMWGDLINEKGAKPPSEIVCQTCKTPREEWVMDIYSICSTCGEVMERSIDSGAE